MSGQAPAERTGAAGLVLAAERRLLQPEVRRDAAALRELLDPGFREVGQSGRLWTRAEIVPVLLAADPAGLAGHRLSEEKVTELAPGLFLLTYRLDLDAATTRRCSIWRVEEGRCRLVFHQGTPVPAVRR